MATDAATPRCEEEIHPASDGDDLPYTAIAEWDGERAKKMSMEDLNIGRVVGGRYRLDALLGRGGFGSVYRGWDTQIGRDVAVKLLDVTDRSRTTAQTTQLRERFRREAMAAGRIAHHGVVTIFDFGIPEDGGEAYLVMELLEGHDLAVELVEKGPLHPSRVQKLFIPMLEALGRGHDLGIVHKDIKPQNIFFCHPGTSGESFCLVDFGVARVMHEDKLTMTGLIVGTPQYMAPEYITDTLVTPALDVYQMGLILVELITGQPAVPAGESFVKSCNRHFTGDLAIPAELLEGDFGQMLQMALRPIPKDRIPSATRFAEVFAELDVSTIVIESQTTMVFRRELTPTYTEPPMFPPMRPDEVSAELARLEQEADTHTEPHETPSSMTRPAELERPASSEKDTVQEEQSGESVAATAAPPAATAPATVKPVRATPDAAPPPPPVQLEAIEAMVAMNAVSHTEPTSRRVGLLPVMFVLTLVLVSAAALVANNLTGGDDDDRAASRPVTPTGADPATVATTTELTIETPEMTTITSDPSGARIVVDGREIGETPGSVEIGRADVAELHLQGYEVALVRIEAHVPTIELRKLSGTTEPAPPPRTTPTDRKKPRQLNGLAAGRVFDPEEPETPTDRASTQDGPVKFERATTAPVQEPWKAKTPPIEIAE